MGDFLATLTLLAAPPGRSPAFDFELLASANEKRRQRIYRRTRAGFDPLPVATASSLESRLSQAHVQRLFKRRGPSNVSLAPEEQHTTSDNHFGIYAHRACEPIRILCQSSPALALTLRPLQVHDCHHGPSLTIPRAGGAAYDDFE